MNRRVALMLLGMLYSLGTTFAGDRLTIEIFPYVSVGNTDPGLVQNLLKQKIYRLAEETISAHPDLHQLNDVKVVELTDRLPASPQALAKYWNESGDALEILSGAVFSNPTTVTSTIYLGELQGSLIRRTVTIETSLTPDEFLSYRDMHGALMLYALAMNAKARVPQQRGVISQYLAEAESLLKNIQASNSPDPAGSVRALSDAVAKELAALKR